MEYCGKGNEPTHQNREIAVQTARENAASKILGQLEKLVGLAECLANKAENRLAPITSPSAPAKLEDGKPSDALPGYFEAVRSKLLTLERQLHSIENTLDRLEI